MGLRTAIFFETPEQIFLRVFGELKPRTIPPGIQIEYCKFANANSFIRLSEAKLTVRICDILQGAPAPIVESLAYILISKLYRKEVPRTHLERYRRFLNRREVRRTLQLIRQARGRKFISGARGETYDLNEIFERLNFEYFHGLMARPELGWSRRASQTMLGHFDPSHNAIILSKLLDNERVPRIAVEYVLFHEMLHLKFPVAHEGARRCVHTPEFKAEERRFAGYSEAKEILKKL